MKPVRLAFISFKPVNGKLTAFVSIEDAIANEDELVPRLKKAENDYAVTTRRIKSIISRNNECRKSKRPIKARAIWNVGDEIFRLIEILKSNGFQLDGVYTHFERDLILKQKWLEKVITLRRYVMDGSLIPASLNWSELEKGTKRKAEKLILK